MEQEVLQAMKLRKQLRSQLNVKENSSSSESEEEEKVIKEESKSEVKIQETMPPEKPRSIHELTKDQVYKIWEYTLKDVPTDYDFVIKSQQDCFPKGSQVYLCYGRMSNRDALKRYGFCLTSNKYNTMYIKLRLEQHDEEFKYRQYIISKFFSVDKSKHEEGDAFEKLDFHENSMDV